MEKNKETKFSGIGFGIDVLSYALFAAAFIIYGIYSLFLLLWETDVIYFISGIVILLGIIFTIARDLYHMRMGSISKVALFVLIATSAVFAIFDLITSF